MKQRLISAIIAAIILVPILIIGGNIFYLTASILGIIGLFELLRLKKMPIVMQFIALISFILILINDWPIDIVFNLQSKIFIILIASLVPTIFYKKEDYSIEDAFYMLACVLFLGLSISNIAIIRMETPIYFIYLLIITVFTDTFAYFTGNLIGRHKLCPDVSPNKTVEGFIGGVSMSLIIGTLVLYHFTRANLFNIIIISLILSITSQIGDLVFSQIKRYFKIKDFGNIMPGHGGVLDRVDSLVFVSILFSFLQVLI